MNDLLDDSSQSRPSGGKNRQPSNFFRLSFSLVFVVLLILGGAALYFLYAGMTVFPEPRAISSGGSENILVEYIGVSFNPPRPEDAPKDILEDVLFGYHILTDTQKYARQYIGNELQCSSCHFNGGRELNTLSLVGVAAKYPKYRSRRGGATDLVTRTQGCFQRSMNGKPLPPEGEHMQGLMAYYHWISKDIPIYADIPWLGLKKLTSNHTPNKEAGKDVFMQVCSRCHGNDGHGSEIAPPLWGPGSFNDGAGMHKLENFSAFAHHFMPKNNPVLTVEEALDVAAYATSQPRPHFESAN